MSGEYSRTNSPWLSRKSPCENKTKIAAVFNCAGSPFVYDGYSRGAPCLMAKIIRYRNVCIEVLRNTTDIFVNMTTSRY